MKRSQAALALGSLVVGAAITSMLLNLYGDVRRKMTEDFRAYGANVVVAPASAGTGGSVENRAMLGETAVAPIAQFAHEMPGTLFTPILYGVVRVSPDPADPRLPEFANVVAAGANFGALRRLNPGGREAGEVVSIDLPPGDCAVGANLAARLHVRPGDSIQLHRVVSVAEDPVTPCGSAASLCGKAPPFRQVSHNNHLLLPTARAGRLSLSARAVGVGLRSSATERPSLSAQQTAEPQVLALRIATVLTTGASEDDQIFLPLGALQSFLGIPGKVTLVEVSIPGETRDVEGAVHQLAALLPGTEVRPIRQIVYSEGKVLGTIRWLLLSLTIMILVIIALCVMATMTAIVLERRKDIGVMKALGAADALLMRLFVTEGAGLGLVGGVFGYALGAVLARVLGERLFGVALGLNAWTLPVVCSLTVALAVIAAQVPVRLVRAIQPTIVLKGE
ncbi:MAG: ABC transporter permease [Terriglobia bacterium]